MVTRANPLRALPAVETLLNHPALAEALGSLPRPLVVEAARTELSEELVRVYSEAALARAEEAFRITRAAFERGAQSLLDVLDAQRTLSQTRVAVNQSRFTYLSNLFLLQQASGVDGLVELR